MESENIYGDDENIIVMENKSVKAMKLGFITEGERKVRNSI